jgi:hypothetical protein
LSYTARRSAGSSGESRGARTRILLIDDPSIGSRIPDDHLPSLGLLAAGGLLIDNGHVVQLIDGEFGPMSMDSIVAEAVRLRRTRCCSAIPARPPAIR